MNTYHDDFFEKTCPNCTYFNSINADMNKKKNPSAIAHIRGSQSTPNISGFVHFFDVEGGTMVYVDVKGLPPFQPATKEKMQIGPHGFHIHDGNSCEPLNGAEPFRMADGHWNPDNQPHGNHIKQGTVTLQHH